MAKIRRGDKVIVIAGKDRHKSGLVERVLPKDNRVVVSGINMVKKHLKKSAQNPAGGIIDKQLPIHISNVMLLDPSSGKPTRLGSRQEGQGRVRIARVSNQIIKNEK